MTWARNIFIVTAAFLMGRSSARLGWQTFAAQQVVLLVIGAGIIAVWFLVEYMERRVKGKPNAAVTIRQPTSGATANVPIRFCPKCGVRLASGAFAHVETCHGSAA